MSDSGDGGPAYAIIDVERLQDFIFEVGQLRDIRGASALLSELEQNDVPQCIARHGGSRVQGTGGVTLARFDARVNASAFLADVRRLYASRTGGAVTVATAVAPSSANRWEDHNRLQILLRSAKDERREGKGFASVGSIHLPQLKLCTECGRRPATVVVSHREAKDTFHCSVCRVRDVEGKRTGLDKLPVEQRIIEALQKKWGHTIRVPHQFQDFTEKRFQSRRCREKSFMGLVTADGNGIGDWMDEVVSKTWEAEKSAEGVDRRLEAMSDALQDTFEQTLLDSVEAVFGDDLSRERLVEGSTTHLPVRLLVCGGDDLALVTEASRALELSSEIASRFDSAARSCFEKRGIALEKPLSLSAAVVLGKADYPFVHFRAIAARLLGVAKRWRRVSAGTTDCVVHLGVVRSTLPEPAETGSLGLPGGWPKRASELQAFVKKGLTWVARRELPASKFKGLAGSLRQDAKEASAPHEEPRSLEYQVWRSHLAPGERASLDAMLKDLGFKSAWAPREFGPNPRLQFTPLADLIELSDFCGD